MEEKLKVGQKVFVQPTGNAARYNKEIIESEIESIGRKYFKLKGFYRERFFVDSLSHDGQGYVSNYQVWLSKKDHDEYVKKGLLYSEFNKYFSSFSEKHDLSLSQLERINEIIQETKEQLCT